MIAIYSLTSREKLTGPEIPITFRPKWQTIRCRKTVALLGYPVGGNPTQYVVEQAFARIGLIGKAFSRWKCRPRAWPTQCAACGPSVSAAVPTTPPQPCCRCSTRWAIGPADGRRNCWSIGNRRPPIGCSASATSCRLASLIVDLPGKHVATKRRRGRRGDRRRAGSGRARRKSVVKSYARSRGEELDGPDQRRRESPCVGSLRAVASRIRRAAGDRRLVNASPIEMSKPQARAPSA